VNDNDLPTERDRKRVAEIKDELTGEPRQFQLLPGMSAQASHAAGGDRPKRRQVIRRVGRHQEFGLKWSGGLSLCQQVINGQQHFNCIALYARNALSKETTIYSYSF